MLTYLLWFVAALAVLAIVLKIAFPLPPHANLPPDPALPAITSPMMERTEQLSQAHPELTGLYLLPDGLDAFAMRLGMVRQAQRSIDARYYIWEGDLSGRMLLAEIVAAADRGVRVRLLIDDNPTAGLDPMWAGVNAHPNIAVRLFNPLTIRAVRPANYLFDFFRLNRRMHNKSFTVDDVATVIGGRNIGDEYFGAKSEGLFIDLDTLAVGAVVPDVAADFERYWTSEPAFPADVILAGKPGLSLSELRDPNYADAELTRDYRAAADGAIETLRFDETAAERLTWAPVRLVSDNPDKALDKAKRTDLMAYQIAPVIMGAKTRFDLVSGYFVPGKEGTAMIANLARNGVATRVVTNSIQVTDVPIVHAGYDPYRPDLLNSGVQLYEARPANSAKKAVQTLGNTRFSGGGESVHAKTFAVDDRIFFVGSFNFDPRSALLNCEMGFLIDSPELARAFTAGVSERVPEFAYHVQVAPDGVMTWTEQDDGKAVTYRTEPGTTVVSRALVTGMSLLPIEWLL